LDTAAAAEAPAATPAAGQHNKISSHRRWSHTKELATSWHGRPLYCRGTPGPPLGPPAGGHTEQGVATSALCECGSGAPRRRALRGPCLCSNPPGGGKKEGRLIRLGATSSALPAGPAEFQPAACRGDTRTDVRIDIRTDVWTDIRADVRAAIRTDIRADVRADVRTGIRIDIRYTGRCTDRYAETDKRGKKEEN
jgi:hypothetical protein